MLLLTIVFFRFSSALGLTIKLRKPENLYPGTFPSQSFAMALHVCCIVASHDKYVFSVETRASGVIFSISVSERVRSDGTLTDTTGTGTAGGEAATAAGGVVAGAVGAEAITAAFA